MLPVACPVSCPSVDATQHDPDKRLWLIATGAAAGAAALATAAPFVSSFAPSERAKAAGGPVEVDISDIPPGGAKTVEWRGKPVWVVQRTPEMIAALQGHDAELVDPMSAQDQQPGYAKNAARAIRPEIFVAIGICTHLGCSPSSAPKGANNPSLPADWPTGRVASSAPATAPPSTAPGACSRKSRHRPTSRSRRTAMPATRGSSSATTLPPERN